MESSKQDFDINKLQFEAAKKSAEAKAVENQIQQQDGAVPTDGSEN
jgi:hypothetical protein